MRDLTEVRTAYENGEGTLRKLAAEFQIPARTVFRRSGRERWRRPSGNDGPIVESASPTAKSADPIYFTVGEYAREQGVTLAASSIRAMTRRAKALCRRRAIPVLPVNETQTQEWWAFPPEALAELFESERSDRPRRMR